MFDVIKTDSGDWLVDANGNRASVATFGSYESAANALASLINCNECIDCINCVDCVGCIKCKKMHGGRYFIDAFFTTRV